MALVRYIRDWLGGSNITPTNRQWVEIQAYETVTANNVALGKPTSYKFQASDTGYTSTGTSGAVITDGSTDWTGNYAVGGTGNIVPMLVDLGALYDLQAVGIWHVWLNGDRVYTATKTEVSADNVNWVTLFDSAVSGTYAETSSGKFYLVPATVAAAALSGSPASKSTVTGTLGSWPAGSWVTYGNEGAVATVAANTLVRYGANGFWVERVMSGTFTFDNATFGDPIGGTAKVGQIWTATAGATAAALAGSPASKSTVTGNLTSSAQAFSGALASKSTIAGTLTVNPVTLAGLFASRSTITGNLTGGTTSFAGNLLSRSTVTGNLTSVVAATTHPRKMFLGF